MTIRSGRDLKVSQSISTPLTLHSVLFRWCQHQWPNPTPLRLLHSWCQQLTTGFRMTMHFSCKLIMRALSWVAPLNQNLKSQRTKQFLSTLFTHFKTQQKLWHFPPRWSSVFSLLKILRPIWRAPWVIHHLSSVLQTPRSLQHGSTPFQRLKIYRDTRSLFSSLVLDSLQNCSLRHLSKQMCWRSSLTLMMRDN